MGRRWGSLQTKIIIWSFIPSAIILLAVALINFYAYQQVAENLVLERNKSILRLSANQLSIELEEYTTLLATVAQRAELTLNGPGEQQTALAPFSNRLTAFDGGVIILDNFGKVAATEPNRPEITGQNWSGRPYFRRIINVQETVFSDIINDGPQEKPVVIAAVPLTGRSGQFLGMIGGLFQLGTPAVSAFYGDIVKLRLNQTGNTYLLDSQGQVIFHSDAVHIGADFSNQAAVQQALQGKVNSFRTQDNSGEEIVAGFAPVARTPWSLVSEEKWATLTQSGQNYQQFLLLLLALGVIIPMLVVTWGAKRITQPITELIAAAQAVAKGNFGLKITASTGNEIETLAQQFNLMSTQLHASYTNLEQRVADRTKELETLTRQLALLNAISISVHESLDLSETLRRTLDETLEILNMEAGAIFLVDEERNELVIRAHYGFSPEFARLAGRRKITDILPESAILSGEPVIDEDVWTNPDRPFSREEGLRTLAIFPLKAKDELLGTLGLGTRREPRHFTHAERELLRAISDQVAVAIDHAHLYNETIRRVDEIESLFAVQQAITSRLDLNSVLQLIADEARRLTTTRGALVFMSEGDMLRLAVFSGEADFDAPIGYQMPLSASALNTTINTGQPLRIDDAQHDPRPNADLTRRVQAQSLMIVPVMSGSSLIGTISLVDKSSGYFDSNDERVLMMLASSAAIGLENARLYQEEQERHQEADQRRQVAEGLRDIMTILNSNRPLDDILETIVAQATRLLEANAAAIYRLQSKDGPLKIQAGYGLPAEYVAKIEIPLNQGLVGQAVQRRQPITFPNPDNALNSGEFLKQDHSLRALFLETMAPYQARLAVPLIIKDEVYGGMVLYYTQLRDFSDEDIGLAVSFADQVALAIENARLFAQAEQAAILEERQRLARELHDSVTQSLYGVTMFAEAATRLLKSNQIGLVAEHLQELRSTAQEALQEMRLLIFELRPSVLEEAGLAAALQTRLEAVERRSGLVTELKVEGIPTRPLSPKVEEGLYRLAQESLNNILKHAQAQHVSVCLYHRAQGVKLEITDDGVGFDPATIRQRAGLGLRGMEERAKQLGATLTIASQPNQGASVIVEVAT